MKRSSIIWEAVAWTVFFPAALVLALRRMLGHGTAGPDERIAALLRWYPEAWRAKYGEGLGEVLRDTIAGERDSVRVSLDVAREGLVERARAFVPERLVASLMLSAGWIAFFPQGVVAAVLSFTGVPPTWFLALHFESAERWLVIAAMVAGGLVLIDRSLWGRAPVRPRYGLSLRPVANSHTLQATDSAAMTAVIPSDTPIGVSLVPRKP
jgi:hypothetical protein